MRDYSVNNSICHSFRLAGNKIQQNKKQNGTPANEIGSVECMLCCCLAGFKEGSPVELDWKFLA